MNPIQKLHSLGQSLWYDNIERRLINNGDLKLMIKSNKIRGMTSNPSIFNKAITQSNDYDDELIPLVKAGKTKEEIYEHLVITDIKAACDLFRPLYDKTNGGDGYVSLEVNPYLANDSVKTVEEAKRLWKLVDRPNLMVKIPATLNGLSAIAEAVSAGININITLIFAIERYEAVVNAYLSGLEKRVSSGTSIGNVSSVASFFVSRIDSNVDTRVDKIIDQDQQSQGKARNLKGKIAVANAKLAYDLSKQIFSSYRFMKLHESGAKLQRVLWASTSTKNPDYPDTKYVDELIGPNTINTVPPKTLLAFEDHGRASLTLEKDLPSAKLAMEDLALTGISMKEVTDELEQKGVESFAKDYTSLLDSIEKRRLEVLE